MNSTPEEIKRPGAWAQEWGDEFMMFATKSGARERAWQRWRAVWGLFTSRRRAFEDGFAVGARAALITVDEISAISARAHLLAQADLNTSEGEAP